MKAHWIFLLLLPTILFAEETKIDSKLTSATVFFKGAQLQRQAKSTLQAGTTEIVLSGIENYIDEKSIQVYGKGEFIIKSFHSRRNYLQTADYSEDILVLEKSLEDLRMQNEEHQLDLEVLRQEEAMILKNQQIGSQESGLNIEQLKKASEFYQTRLKEIKTQILSLSRETKKNNLAQQKVQNQLRQIRLIKQKSINELVIEVEALKLTKAEFDIQYYVSQASWTPFYEVVVDDLTKPITMRYKASVTQQTGTEWKNVKLILSTSQPNLSGEIPKLQPWYLQLMQVHQYNYRSNSSRDAAVAKTKTIGAGAQGMITGVIYDAQLGETLPYASIVAQDAMGNTVSGATSDADGKFSFHTNQKVYRLVVTSMGYQAMVIPVNGRQFNIRLHQDQQLLEEVEFEAIADEAMGYQKKESQVYQTSVLQKRATFFEYDVPSVYTIPSNNLRETIHIRDLSIDTKYEYQTVPKLDKDVFLIAKIFDWEAYNLLNGNARLYFQNTFVGESYLNVQATSDTLGLSLGRDKNIVVSREKVFEESGVKSLSGNIKESRAFEIQIRNNKDIDIQLVVMDQYPISKNKQINVKLNKHDANRVDENRHFLYWNIPLKAHEEVKKGFKYEVSFPSELSVMINE